MHYAEGFREEAISIFRDPQHRADCTGYAHLPIAFLRSIGIPARYVSSYTLTKTFCVPKPKINRTVAPGARVRMLIMKYILIMPAGYLMMDYYFIILLTLIDTKNQKAWMRKIVLKLWVFHVGHLHQLTL